MAKTKSTSPAKGRKTKATTPVKESLRRSTRKTSPTKRYDGTETTSKVVKQPAVKQKASPLKNAYVTFDDLGIGEDASSQSYRAPSSAKQAPKPRGRRRKTTSTESLAPGHDEPDSTWTDSPTKKSPKKTKATGKRSVIADRDDEDEELYRPSMRQASVGGVRGSIEERTTAPIPRSLSKSPAKKVGRPSKSPNRTASGASTGRARSTSPTKESRANAKAQAPLKSPVANRTRSRSPKDDSKSITALGLQVLKTRTSRSPSKSAQQGARRSRSVSPVKAAQSSPTKIARSRSQSPVKSPRKSPVKSPLRSRSVSPIKRTAASSGRARSKSPAKQAEPAFPPAFLKRLKSRGRDGERLRNVEDIFYDDPSSGMTYANADTTMTEDDSDLAADHGIWRHEVQHGRRTGGAGPAGRRQDHDYKDDLERVRLSEFLDDSDYDSYENAIEQEDILHGGRRLFDDEDYDDVDKDEDDGRRRRASPVKRGRSPAGPSKNARAEAIAGRTASMSPRKRGRLGLGQSPLRQASRAGTSSATKEAIPRLKGGKEPIAPSLKSGRGNVISSTNPPYVPGMEKKKNPFFETMPGVEVWHRRMPPFLPFGETPFMERVMSRQINDDLSKGNDKKDASNSGILGRFNSWFSGDKNSAEGHQRASPWTLPQVKDEEVNRLASTFGAEKRRASTTIKPAPKRVRRRSSSTRR